MEIRKLLRLLTAGGFRGFRRFPLVGLHALGQRIGAGMAVLGDHRLLHPAGIDIIDGLGLDFLGRGCTASLRPDINLILPEKKLLGSFVIGNQFVVDPAVHGWLCWMVREVGTELGDSEPDDTVFVCLEFLFLFGLWILQLFFDAVKTFDDGADGRGTCSKVRGAGVGAVVVCIDTGAGGLYGYKKCSPRRQGKGEQKRKVDGVEQPIAAGVTTLF